MCVYVYIDIYIYIYIIFSNAQNDVDTHRPAPPLPALTVCCIGIFRCPLFRGPLIIGLHVLI